MIHRNQENHRSPPKKQGLGFTLAEMIIVMGILAIMATMGTRTYFTERDRFEFSNALIKTMQLVKAVRTYATTSYPIYIDREGFTQSIVPLNGYGIRALLDKDTKKFTLTVFANVDTGSGTGLGRYQNDNYPQKLDEDDIILETYTLPKQIVFRYFYFDDVMKWKVDPNEPEKTGPTAFEATMVFRPPLGELTLMEATSSNPMNELGLEFQNPALEAEGPKKCQRIKINKVKMFPELMYESACQ